MNDKYVKLADVKRKLRYIFKTYGVGSFVREKIERTLNNLPYSVKGDLETTLEATDVQPVNQWISVGDELPEWDKTVLVWYASDTLFGVSEGYGLSWYHGSWRLNDLNGENIRIFYWRYLPEKPKGGTMNNDL